jgi:hypothetical protein
VRLSLVSGLGRAAETEGGDRTIRTVIDFAGALAPRRLRYRCGNGEFALFESAAAAAGDHTQMAWEVDDLEETIAQLRERGVIFEEYDAPGLETVNGIAEVEGNYPSKGGVGEKAAWFKDSEGNLLAIGQAVT